MTKISEKSVVKFHNKTFKFFISTVLVFILIFCSVVEYWVYKSNISERTSVIVEQGNKDYDNISNMFDNCMRICWYFATYDTVNPYIKIDLGMEKYKSVILKEIDSFMAGYNFIEYIEVKSSEYTVSKGDYQNADFSLLQQHNGYDIYYTKNQEWPQLVKICYSSVANFSVTLVINSEEFGKANLSANSFFIAADGTVIFSADQFKIGRNISELFDNSITVNSKSSNKYFIKSRTYGENSFVYLVYDMQDIKRAIISQMLLILFVVIMITVVIVILINYSLKKIYSPIDKTVQILKYYLPNNTEFLDKDTEYISKAIHTQGYEASTENIIKNIRQSQLHVLHSQISPHFLSNSLEVIKWKIIEMIDINPQIERSLSILRTFFDDSYKYSKMISTISDEIIKTENYCTIAKYCFNEDLEIIWDVDNSIYDKSIIALTLQPLIENSVFHGFSNTNSIPIIRISIKSKSDKIIVTVSDNGMGMTSERLESIKKSLLDDEYSEHHIGIKNTHLKYNLLFGKDYGITEIKSDENGTSITLIYPDIN